MVQLAAENRSMEMSTERPLTRVEGAYKPAVICPASNCANDSLDWHWQDEMPRSGRIGARPGRDGPCRYIDRPFYQYSSLIGACHVPLLIQHLFFCIIERTPSFLVQTAVYSCNAVSCD